MHDSKSFEIDKEEYSSKYKPGSKTNAGINLKFLRFILGMRNRRKGLNLKELSSEVGIPRSTLRAIEVGTTSRPNFDTVTTIIQYFRDEIPYIDKLITIECFIEDNILDKIIILAGNLPSVDKKAITQKFFSVWNDIDDPSTKLGLLKKLISN